MYILLVTINEKMVHLDESVVYLDCMDHFDVSYAYSEQKHDGSHEFRGEGLIIKYHAGYAV